MRQTYFVVLISSVTCLQHSSCCMYCLLYTVCKKRILHWKRANNFMMWSFQGKCLISMEASGNSGHFDTSYTVIRYLQPKYLKVGGGPIPKLTLHALCPIRNLCNRYFMHKKYHYTWKRADNVIRTWHLQSKWPKMNNYDHFNMNP